MDKTTVLLAGAIGSFLISGYFFLCVLMYPALTVAPGYRWENFPYTMGLFAASALLFLALGIWLSLTIRKRSRKDSLVQDQ